MPKNKVFVDSSALIAYLREKDSCHKKAVKTWNDLRKPKTIFIISNYVFAEFLTVIRQRLGIKIAIETGKLVRKASFFEKIWIDKFSEEKAWKIFTKSKIKNLSFVDCTSFVCMKDLGIKRVFTFDKHFEKSDLGFEVLN